MRDAIWEDEGISKLPYVREFLEARGVQSIRELSKEARKELEQHLKDTLKSIKNPDTIH